MIAPAPGFATVGAAADFPSTHRTVTPVAPESVCSAIHRQPAEEPSSRADNLRSQHPTWLVTETLLGVGIRRWCNRNRVARRLPPGSSFGVSPNSRRRGFLKGTAAHHLVGLFTPDLKHWMSAAKAVGSPRTFTGVAAGEYVAAATVGPDSKYRYSGTVTVR